MGDESKAELLSVLASPRDSAPSITKPVLGVSVLEHSVLAIPVLVFCRTCGVDFERRVADEWRASSSQSSEFQPSIVDGDFKLRGCNSILRYLSQKYFPDWYPADDLQTRAQVDQTLEVTQPLLRHLSTAVQFTALNYDPHYNRILQYHLEQVLDGLRALQRMLTSNKESAWIVSEAQTIADLSIACGLLPLTLLKFLDWSEFQPIVNWVDKVAQSCGEHFYDEAKLYGVEKGRPVLYGRHLLLHFQVDPLSTKNVDIATHACETVLDTVDHRFSLQESKRAASGNGIKVLLEPDATLESLEQRIVADCVIRASYDDITQFLRDFEATMRAVEPLSKDTRKLSNLEKELTVNYFSYEVTQKREQINRQARFDFVVLHHWRRLPDGSFVSAFTSLDGYQSKKGYVRARIDRSGWVVRRLPGRLPRCQVTLALNIVFPARVSKWVVQKLRTRGQEYIKGLKKALHVADTKSSFPKPTKKKANLLQGFGQPL